MNSLINQNHNIIEESPETLDLELQEEAARRKRMFAEIEENNKKIKEALAELKAVLAPYGGGKYL